MAGAALRAVRAGVEAFNQDCKEFVSLIDWKLFTQIAAIFARYGHVAPDGSKVGSYMITESLTNRVLQSDKKPPHIGVKWCK
eukprot:2747681-Amphidinium_carterae.1